MIRHSWSICAAACLSGCLYTTQHFNSGRLLDPGQTAVTIGVGRAHFYRDHCPDGYYPSDPESNGKTVCRWDRWDYRDIRDMADTVRPVSRARETLPKIGFGYRLGVRRQWGLLTGIEIGWGLEGPTNPATLEFDLKAGLPAPRAWKVSHSLSAGWGVGAWVDNTLFLEYALARSFGKSALFANYRFSGLATQPDDLDSSFDAGRFVSVPHFAHQIACGWYQALWDIPVLPDYLVPEFILTAPVFGGGGLRINRPPAYDLNFNVGFGWDF